MQTDVLLHIGMGKSGSSALQTFLSAHPTCRLDGNKLPYRHLQYLSFNKEGRSFHGKRLYAMAHRHPFRHLRSVAFSFLRDWPDSHFEALKKLLQKLSDEGQDLPVLSSESWCLHPQDYLELDLGRRLQISPSLLCYIRNPVELINSAWWQWGAWNPTGSFERFVRSAISHLQSLEQSIETWERISEGRLQVVPLPSDITEDFCKRFGISPCSPVRSNVSLPEELLRFFQRHRELRPGPHEATADFYLSELLDFDGYGKTPWVLPPSMVEEILRQMRPVIERVSKYFDDTSRQRYEADPRWHDPAAFADRVAVSPDPPDRPLDPERLETMLFDAYQALINLRREHLTLQTRYDRLQAHTEQKSRES